MFCKSEVSSKPVRLHFLLHILDYMQRDKYALNKEVYIAIYVLQMQHKSCQLEHRLPSFIIR